MVGAGGLEPPTPGSQNRCATGLRYAPEIILKPLGLREYYISEGVNQGESNPIQFVGPDRSLLCPGVVRFRSLHPPAELYV